MESSAILSAVANTFSKSGVENLASDATLGEKFMYGLKYTAIGLVTVFLVLILLMAVMYVLRLIFARDSFKSKAKQQVSPISAPTNVVNETKAVANENDEETLVAVATAAIAASRGSSDCAFKV
ncbi:MAG: OadG family protein, partial [Clostridia bacterium]